MNKVMILFLIVSFSALSKQKVLGVYYIKNFFGHVHDRQSAYAASLTTLGCGHPVKAYSKRNIKPSWLYIKTAGVKGYIQRDFVSNRKPDCFQSNYPKFFNSLDLSLSEMYYWGKLYDMYKIGKSKVR